MYHVTHNKKQDGQLILIVLVFTAVVLILVGSLVAYAGVQIKSHRQAIGRVQGLDIAEAGIEKALWRLNNEIGYTGESGTSFNGGVYNITVTDINITTKLIKADVFLPDATNPRAKRTVQVKATTGTTHVSFNYGVQVGQGGLGMTNSSLVNGNVYSNGNIIGANSARITGTAIAATPTGKIYDIDIDQNATAHFIEDSTIGGSSYSLDLKNSTVGGNAITDTMSNCTIGGNATYDTKTSCTILGTQTTPNPNQYYDLASVNLPISSTQIDEWEAEAEAGGVITSQSYSSGTTTLGPKKINGDLTVINTATLIVAGTLWVTGQITLSNSAVVRLASSYGSGSGVIIAGIDGSSTAGFIDLNNGVSIQGSGTGGSYLMLLSQRNTTSSAAIDAGDSSTALILYAGSGLINVKNSGQFKGLTAAKISIGNSATITYESGLANAGFTSGPAGGWELSPQTWQLIQ